MIDPSIALCPGTYDPPTLGHLDVIRRAARLFDRVIVGVADAPSHKHPLFTASERIELLRDGLRDMENVTFETFAMLAVEFARTRGARALVRGLRTSEDFALEHRMGQLNANLAPEIETVLLVSRPESSFVSSSAVREIASYGGDVSAYVTPLVNERLRTRT